jgi:ribose transport system permease protein
MLVRFGMVWVLIAVIIAAQIIYPGFLEWGNVKNVLSQNAQVGIIAVGMTFVMIAGGFDLSVGAILASAAVFYADMANRMPFWIAFILAVLLGVAMGAVNGLIVTRLKVNPFVATLGTASIFGGGAFLYSKSAPILNNKEGFEKLGQSEVAGLPASVWIMIVIFIVGAFFLARTVYGRSLYAIGGNNEASRLAGLRTDTLRASTYVLVGACSAVGGAIVASRLQVGQADVGATTALDAIAVVVIGGTSLFGGEGAVWRSAIGLGIVAAITNLSDSEGWDINVQSVIKGAIVIGAVALDSWVRSRRT